MQPSHICPCLEKSSEWETGLWNVRIPGLSFICTEICRFFSPLPPSSDAFFCGAGMGKDLWSEQHGHRWLIPDHPQYSYTYTAGSLSWGKQSGKQLSTIPYMDDHGWFGDAKLAFFHEIQPGGLFHFARSRIDLGFRLLGESLYRFPCASPSLPATPTDQHSFM